MSKIVIIDYGSGNLHSALKAFERAAQDVKSGQTIALTSDPEEVIKADRLVLPGVGAFADCLQGLKAVDGMLEALAEAVIQQSKPFLGICVGMQLLATQGLEHGTTSGLNWIPGEVRAIEPDDPNLKIPHMGWNTLRQSRPHPLLDNIELGPDGLHAYFVHSYHFAAAEDAHKIAETDHGGPVTAMIAKDNIAGTQFHPEKSQTLGLKLITNFLKWNVA